MVEIVAAVAAGVVRKGKCFAEKDLGIAEFAEKDFGSAERDLGYHFRDKNRMIDPSLFMLIFSFPWKKAYMLINSPGNI